MRLSTQAPAPRALSPGRELPPPTTEVSPPPKRRTEPRAINSPSDLRATSTAVLAARCSPHSPQPPSLSRFQSQACKWLLASKWPHRGLRFPCLTPRQEIQTGSADACPPAGSPRPRGGAALLPPPTPPPSPSALSAAPCKPGKITLPSHPSHTCAPGSGPCGRCNKLSQARA